jgi:GT2 family glycosyltransferase
VTRHHADPHGETDGPGPERRPNDQSGYGRCDREPDPATAAAAATAPGQPIRAVAAIVPAHNEHDLLPDCLAALRHAAGHPGLHGTPVLVLVVADQCTDHTAFVAHRAGAHVALTEAHNVGVARSVGAARAAEILEREGFRDDEIWFAYTDADTLVPPDWLARHLAHAAEGYSAVLGTVRVNDWSPRPPGTAALFEDRESRVPESERVHGANLGIRADVYRRAGGFPALAGGEDHALAASLRRLGFRVKPAPDMTVTTSARISHRVAGGFSDYLNRLGPET